MLNISYCLTYDIERESLLLFHRQMLLELQRRKCLLQRSLAALSQLLKGNIMRNWYDRDHKKYTKKLQDLIEYILAEVPMEAIGTSGVGELTLKYQSQKNENITGRSSFYVRPISPDSSDDHWLVKRVLNKEEFYIICPDKVSVLSAMDEFPAGFSPWLGREKLNKENYSSDLNAVGNKDISLERAKKNEVSSLIFDVMSVMDFSIATKSKMRYQREILSVLIWKYTEVSGSKKGNKLWTESALDKYSIQQDYKGLIHEHTIPRRVLIDHISSGVFKSEGELSDFLFKNCMAVVVTAEEDELLRKAGLNSRMPDGWSFNSDDKFARYNKAGLSQVVVVS